MYHRGVFLLFGALVCALACLWMAGQALPAQATGRSGRDGPVQPARPTRPDPTGPAQMENERTHKTIYWGALISGSTYGRGNPPWDEGAIDQFEQNAGKPISILHWGQSWWRCQAKLRLPGVQRPTAAV